MKILARFIILTLCFLTILPAQYVPPYERWNAIWLIATNKDNISTKTRNNFEKQLADGGEKEIGEAVSTLKDQGAIHSLLSLLIHPMDIVRGLSAQNLSAFPSKEVANALLTAMQKLDSVASGGTEAIIEREEARAAVANTLYKMANITPTPEFSDRFKRNKAIEEAIEKMTAAK